MRSVMTSGHLATYLSNSQQKIQQSFNFYRATLCVGLCALFAIGRCPSVCLSVCLSVRLSRWCIESRRLKISSNFSVGQVAPSF